MRSLSSASTALRDCMSSLLLPVPRDDANTALSSWLFTARTRLPSPPQTAGKYRPSTNLATCSTTPPPMGAVSQTTDSMIAPSLKRRSCTLEPQKLRKRCSSSSTTAALPLPLLNNAGSAAISGMLAWTAVGPRSTLRSIFSRSRTTPIETTQSQALESPAESAVGTAQTGVCADTSSDCSSSTAVLSAVVLGTHRTKLCTLTARSPRPLLTTCTAAAAKCSGAGTCSNILLNSFRAAAGISLIALSAGLASACSLPT